MSTRLTLIARLTAKHALESIAEAVQQELTPYGIKVQTINPGAYYTGYNETMADNPFRRGPRRQRCRRMSLASSSTGARCSTMCKVSAGVRVTRFETVVRNRRSI